MTCILTVCGFITATIEYELTYVYRLNHIETRSLKTTNTYWGIITTFFTILAIISIVFRHHLKRSFQKQTFKLNQGPYGTQIESMKKKKPKGLITKTFIFEILITIIQPIPFYNHEFNLYFISSDHTDIIEV